MHLPWTPEQIALLRLLIADGLSSQAIAKRFGKPRNAIIGKARRLGLHFLGRAGPPKAPRAPGAPKAGPKAPPRRNKRARPPTPTKHSARPTTAAAAAAVLSLRRGCCKWPLGEGDDFHFCGRAAAGTYCPAHTKQAQARSSSCQTPPPNPALSSTRASRPRSSTSRKTSKNSSPSATTSST